MNILETIQTRRSVRRYKPDPVPPDALADVLEAARWAPSWGNTQCLEIVKVQDAAMRRQLDATLAKKNSARKSLIEAPVCLAICGKNGISGYYEGETCTQFGDWLMFDCALAVQNLCLAAHALGLGTVVIGQFDHQLAERLLGVPEGYSLVCLIALGYPSRVPTAPRRKQVSEFTFDESFGR